MLDRLKGQAERARIDPPWQILTQGLRQHFGRGTVRGSQAQGRQVAPSRSPKLLASLESHEGARRGAVEIPILFVRRADPAQVEGAVNRHGYGALQAGQADTARKIFEVNTRLFPDAFNAWDSLGEAQMNLGQNEKAIASYRRSLELNAENQNAETMIQQLEERIAGGD